jgi:hypothetical protein
MTELRFHRSLYPGTAVDSAVKLYAPHAQLELAEMESYWVVRVTGRSADQERKVAGELANYSLGLAATSFEGEERP